MQRAATPLSRCCTFCKVSMVLAVHHRVMLFPPRIASLLRSCFMERPLWAPAQLLLDEPTNHLDLEAIDSLADAINRFQGGLVLVSHDFRLIDQVAKEIWVCDKKKVRPVSQPRGLHACVCTERALHADAHLQHPDRPGLVAGQGRHCCDDMSRVSDVCMRRQCAAHLSDARPQVTVWNDDIRIYKKELIKNMKKRNIL